MKEILRAYKHTPAESISSRCIPIMVKGRIRGRLRPVTADTVHNSEKIAMISEWREASAEWFTTRFPKSAEGTQRWIEEQIIGAEDRILFFVEDENLTPIGQVGLLHYDEEQNSCEFDNLLRGRKGTFGNLMIYALITLGFWSVRVLGLQTGRIQVVGDNHRAIRMYQSLGAEEVKRAPLVQKVQDGIIQWVPAPDQSDTAPERELVTMVIRKESFLNIYKEFYANEL